MKRLMAALFIISVFLFSCANEEKSLPKKDGEISSQVLKESEIKNVAKEFLPLGKCEEKLIMNGNKIIDAVDLYFSKNNKFPDALNDLVPDYISEIPKTGMKQLELFKLKIGDAAFDYYNDGNYFSIKVRYDIFDEWYYNSQKKLWQWANH